MIFGTFDQEFIKFLFCVRVRDNFHAKLLFHFLKKETTDIRLTSNNLSIKSLNVFLNFESILSNTRALFSFITSSGQFVIRDLKLFKVNSGRREIKIIVHS